ncbi:MAG TPA: NTP transferase domain-containing protein, partial [Planctomycetia bacterium]|nr:NTP transferase domain-containing protein [Planctomycetia bacterium]
MTQIAPAAVVMAAGKSTRMKSELPKVLHEVCGRPLLDYVLDALRAADVRRIVVVVGFGKEQVIARFKDVPGIAFVEQTEQRGTGHAVLVTADALAGHSGPVVVLAGDGPFIRPEMIRAMLDRRAAAGAKALLATAVVANPFGMGRIVRDAGGQFVRIVEQKDAAPQEAAINEINPSFYCFDGPALFTALKSVRTDNAQGEYYLTDVPGILRKEGAIVRAEILADETDVFGINDRAQLGVAHRLMQGRIQAAFMASGVTIVDPSSTYLDARAEIGRDTVIEPFTVIRGPVRIGARCRIGPFSHLRPGVTLADDVEIGAFVEVVRSELGEGALVRHLAYLGDARIGAGVNVGAGVITANYDGKTKSETVVGDRAFLGSGAVFVAPVSIGEGAFVGAG